MKRNLLFVPLLYMMSCGTYDKLDVETFPFDFDIEGFYAEDIAKQKVFNIQLKEKINGERTGRIDMDFRSIGIDSVYNFDDELIGIQYNMKSRIIGENIAYYDDMYFDKMNTMKSTSGDFMALVASNESDDTEDVEDLLEYLSSTYGQPEILEEDFFGKFFTYCWNTEDRLIAVGSIFDSKENTLNIRIDNPTEDIQLDNAQDSKIATKLFIVNQHYKELIKEELYSRSGDWVFLHYE